ncbi:MAG: arginase family protein [Bacillaceae bacterium]|nr:arginase family protein [Bacillaceae bacterium]
MGLLHPNVTILNLDGTYLKQGKLLRCPHRRIDLADIPHTRLYCNPFSYRKLQKRLRSVPNGITFIGSGEYHYITTLFLSKINEPFSLILLDHHTDMKSDADLLTCGSWVIDALQHLPMLEKVIIIGADPDTGHLHDQELANRVEIMTPQALRSSRLSFVLSRVLRKIRTETVYVSIDKDVLHPDDAKTRWDQGELRLEELLRVLSFLLRTKRVAGLDVCGEYPVSPLDDLNPEVQKAVSINEAANVKILEVTGVFGGKNSPFHYTGVKRFGGI